MNKARKARLVAAFVAAAWLSMADARAAQPISVGVVSSQGAADVFVAAALGYFAGQGLDAKLVQFPSAAPIANAAASGDVDFGSSGMTAALINLAGGGTIRIIASASWEHPNFPTLGIVASNQAYEKGLHTPADLGGHSVGITQVGTSLQYNLAMVLEKHGILLNAVRVLALQSNPNVASALKGGQVDAGVQDVTNVHVLLDRGDAKLLGWVTDELGSLNAAVTFTTRAMADEHGDTVRKFLAALRQASTAWHDAFIDAGGKRRNGPEAQKMIAIIAEALHQPPDVIANGIGYFDPQNPIALKDLQHQIDWYRAQGMIKGPLDAAAVVDKRYAVFTDGGS